MSIIVHVAPKFSGTDWRTFRAMIFVAMGFSGFAPIIHGTVSYGFHEMLVHRGLMYWFGEGLMFLLGTFFYIVSSKISIISRCCKDVENMKYKIDHNFDGLISTDPDSGINSTREIQLFRGFAPNIPHFCGLRCNGSPCWNHESLRV